MTQGPGHPMRGPSPPALPDSHAAARRGSPKARAAHEPPERSTAEDRKISKKKAQSNHFKPIQMLWPDLLEMLHKGKGEEEKIFFSG
jgi:hypothetical protein